MKLFQFFKLEIIITFIISLFLGFFFYKNYNFPKTFNYEISFNDAINIKNFADKNNEEIYESIYNFKDLVYSNQTIETVNNNLFQFPSIDMFKWVNKKTPSMYAYDHKTFQKLNTILYNHNKKNKIFDSIIFITDKNFSKYVFYKVRIIKYKPDREKVFYDEQISIILDIILEQLNYEFKSLLKERIDEFVINAFQNEYQNPYQKEFQNKILIQKKELFQEIQNLKLIGLDELINFSSQTSKKFLLFNYILLTIIIFLITVYAKRFFEN